jgi:hypothetical protein
MRDIFPSIRNQTSPRRLKSSCLHRSQINLRTIMVDNKWISLGIAIYILWRSEWYEHLDETKTESPNLPIFWLTPNKKRNMSRIAKRVNDNKTVTIGFIYIAFHCLVRGIQYHSLKNKTNDFRINASPLREQLR